MFDILSFEKHIPAPWRTIRLRMSSPPPSPWPLQRSSAAFKRDRCVSCKSSLQFLTIVPFVLSASSFLCISEYGGRSWSLGPLALLDGGPFKRGRYVNSCYLLFYCLWLIISSLMVVNYCARAIWQQEKKFMTPAFAG